MKSRHAKTGLALAALVLLIACLHVFNTVLPQRAVRQSAAEVATRYLNLVAGARESDLDELWAMSVAESAGALRDAGTLLVGASERIEVESVGEPVVSAKITDAPFWFEAEEYWTVPAQIRLAGESVQWPVHLARRTGTSGEESDDWRVLVSDLPILDWATVDLSLGYIDTYVSNVRQTRSILSIGTSERTQPLFPAVYEVQSRVDPWYASEVDRVTVLTDQETTLPSLPLQPTERTKERIANSVNRSLRSCVDGDEARCPAYGLAQDLGIDTNAPNWWLGFSRMPRVSVDGKGAHLRGGIARFRDGGRVRTVSFDGTGYADLDIHTGTPEVFDIELAATR